MLKYGYVNTVDGSKTFKKILYSDVSMFKHHFPQYLYIVYYHVYIHISHNWRKLLLLHLQLRSPLLESRCGQYKLFIKKSREFLGDSFKESQNTPIGGRDELLNVECLRRYSYEHACNKSSTGLQRMGRGVIKVSGRTSSPAIQFSRLVLVV